MVAYERNLKCALYALSNLKLYYSNKPTVIAEKQVGGQGVFFYHILLSTFSGCVPVFHAGYLSLHNLLWPMNSAVSYLSCDRFFRVTFSWAEKCDLTLPWLLWTAWFPGFSSVSSIVGFNLAAWFCRPPWWCFETLHACKRHSVLSIHS